LGGHQPVSGHEPGQRCLVQRAAVLCQLQAYVSAKPLYEWVSNPSGFAAGQTIFTCPTASANGIRQGDIIPSVMVASQRPLFNYAMNSKSLANEPNATLLKSPMVLNPSAFVLFSDVRYRSDDLPFYVVGNANQTDLATPHCYTTRFSARHGSGGNITFSDGHVGFFRYTYVVNTSGKDPGDPDINWDCSGVTVP
jgi:prepilin-type processing-associated H-X9-DG protein